MAAKIQTKMLLLYTHTAIESYILVREASNKQRSVYRRAIAKLSTKPRQSLRHNFADISLSRQALYRNRLVREFQFQ